MPLVRVPLAELEIDDEPSFAHVGLYADLKAIARRDGVTFAVPERGAISWDRALFLNLAFWAPGGADVLTTRTIVADALMHATWHHLANRHVPASIEAGLLGESIASAFDLYLVGRLLGKSPDSVFLETQVGRMSEAAEAAGLDEAGFERLLERAAAEPERSFEAVRELLFDASQSLARCASAEEADRAIDALGDRPFSPLLFHFEIATWVLRAALERARGDLGDGGAAARSIDRELRETADPIRWLDDRWVQPALKGQP